MSDLDITRQAFKEALSSEQKRILRVALCEYIVSNRLIAKELKDMGALHMAQSIEREVMVAGALLRASC